MERTELDSGRGQGIDDCEQVHTTRDEMIPSKFSALENRYELPNNKFTLPVF